MQTAFKITDHKDTSKNIQDEITLSYEERFIRRKKLTTDKLCSFLNIPLVFKGDVFGMLNISNTSSYAFSKDEVTFLHTIANQLSTHLHRLNLRKLLEKTKINSLVKSMSDAVFMLDENQAYR